ncbi:carboxymuconolactone decarboxylase family protein [Myxococcus stipitatus]|uniref:(R)-mandelonitrile lyase n=1 Tax=Myxococcus stipitatus TaxID=83455 RepID=UPI001F42FD71|nr:carboxymuconolactone decarboxylase family protein [Myxococcus stipitatus]MCE9669554.1 carboxymuconolactone decarboxylase family protein [Myxococcus stipitatus]
MIRVTRSGSQSPTRGPAEHFTGIVHIDSPFQADAPARVSGATVMFEPGARTAWHRHPLGQTLLVSSGVGRVQQEGGPIEEVRSGDIVWIPPGAKHWHGASPDSSMSHIAINESRHGSVVEWLEHVTDEEYGAMPATLGGSTAATSLRILQPNVAGRRTSPAGVESVAPALERDTQERLYGEVWRRPGLARRERSLVTVAAMIARGESDALAYELDQAMDNGVTASELSETITHLAYYTGWGNAMSAVRPARESFARRGIDPAQLPSAAASLLPIDEAAEARRKAGVEANFGQVAPGVLHYTTEALFRDLWLRPGLAPRDRSLVTVSALIATGQPAQLTYHLGRAMDHGLTREQASEVLTQLAFYAGWPSVFSALPVVKDVFSTRQD